MNRPSYFHSRALLVIVLILVVFGISTFLIVSPYSPFTGLQNDLKAIEPSLEASYTDLDGNPVLLSSFKGKSIVVNSWASWMPFSKDELMLLNERKRQHGDSLHILAINRMEDKEFIKSYLSALAIDRDILYLTDPTDNFYRAISGYAMPETVFYRKDGTLSAHKRGVLTEQELDQYINTILE
jgi:thiol-disulfide isomerase/thioredoxin